MHKLAKEYVPVPAKEYARKSMYNLNTINPFQDPNVRHTKSEGRDMTQLIADQNIPPEEAILMLRQMLKSYRENVSRVKHKRKPTSMQQEHSKVAK